MTTRIEVVGAARARLGVPFQHRGRNNYGLDCAGLLIVVARELGIVSADFDIPTYSPVPDGTLVGWCDQYMTRIDRSVMQPGDIIGLVTDVDPQHLGILADYRHGGLSIIHASNDRLHKRVIETRLMFARHFAFAGAWAFRGIE